MATRTPTPPPADNFGGDPFQHTTMSFGEHLDELRSSLFKAVLSLAIGFGVGMLFGTSIVNLIQRPLVGALTAHQETKSLERFHEELRVRAEEGDEVAKRILADPDSEELIKQIVNRGGMLPDLVYVDPKEILAELKQHFPETFERTELPGDATQIGKENATADSELVPHSKSDLLPIHLWRSIAEDERNQLISTGAPETFMIWLKASFLGGTLLSSPFVFYFLWSFVAAGLYPHEKQYVHLFLPFSVGLFLLGAVMAFIFVFPPVLNFFFSFNRAFNVNTELRISEWLSFVLLMPLSFGIAFQLPLVMLFLERIGVFTVQSYLSKWKIAVVTLAALSAVLSPGGDPNSMMLMFVPLVGLYFAGIGLCKWLPARRGRIA
jgi:sec-independent protein translocase protein TatC